MKSIAPWWKRFGCCSTFGLLILIAAQTDSAERPAVGDGFDPEAMFRRLDVNGDGRLTLDESRAGDRRLLEKVFEMAGKPTSGSLSRDEFRRVAERHRRGESGPPAGRPSSAANPNRNSPPPHNSQENRPPQNRPPENATPRETANRPNPPPRETATTETARAGERSTTRNENNRLQGVWRGWVVDGRGENPNNGHLQMELRIEGNRMTAREIGARGQNEGLGDGTFVFTSTGRSGNLDATGTSGRHDGVEYLGVYELEGDTLRWCVGNRGRGRPRELASGRGNYLMVLRRQ